MCSLAGPFIGMLGHMTDDVFKFFILYMQFFIPFGKFSYKYSVQELVCVTKVQYANGAIYAFNIMEISGYGAS